jgi:uncharacterized tellurite resistance protein B-like protein
MPSDQLVDPGDESTIGETAGRLMHQFTDVPGLSLTAQQACRLVGAQGALCRIALEQLVNAGWLARNRQGQYTRPETATEIIDALEESGTRRRHSAARGVLPLSPGEAFAAVLLAAARADQTFTSAEAERLADILTGMRLYRDCDRKALNPLLEQLMALLADLGDRVIVHAAAVAVPADLKASLMALAADAVFADGHVRNAERQFLEELQRELGLDDEITQKIFDVMFIKNQA